MPYLLVFLACVAASLAIGPGYIVAGLLFYVLLSWWYLFRLNRHLHHTPDSQKEERVRHIPENCYTPSRDPRDKDRVF